jgi:diamine N-acetyltransferase
LPRIRVNSWLKLVMKIRTAKIEDATNLAQIGWQSFHEAFAGHPKNNPVDMKNYMDEAFSTETIRRDLSAADTIYFVAEVAEKIVGYAKLKTNSREDCISGKNPLELCRLYNLREFIGKGIGKALMLQCLEFAEGNGNDIFWLGVWEFNDNAQRFYAKFGFEKCGEHIFRLGSDPQTDWLMQTTVGEKLQPKFY